MVLGSIYSADSFFNLIFPSKFSLMHILNFPPFCKHQVYSPKLIVPPYFCFRVTWDIYTWICTQEKENIQVVLILQLREAARFLKWNTNFLYVSE